MHTIALFYVPVIHKGYLEAIGSLPPDTVVYVIDKEIIEHIDDHFDYLRKEIRAITPERAVVSLKAIFPEKKIQLLSIATLRELSEETDTQVFLPKEDIFEWLHHQYFANHAVTYLETFLRWDRKNTLEERIIDTKANQLPKELLQALDLAKEESQKSSDWWRQVGCVAVKNGRVIAQAHNNHQPSPYTPYSDGDARNAFHKGEHIDLSTSLHAEAAIIAQCARNGTSLEGSTLVLTTFPCPSCAKLVAHAGVKSMYFVDGYAVLDGERVLKNASVNIQKILI